MADIKVLSSVKNIFMIGIGGIGMTGLALLLKEKGYNVIGSDLQEGYTLNMLREKSITVILGHKKENLSLEIDLVVYSSAVKGDNPEMIEAKARGLSILRRGELLGLLSWDRKTIAVSGSHGKTTTSAFIGYLLTALGAAPTVFVGGVTLNNSKNAWWGGRDYFVIETDESDGSFLYYNPWVSIITNIDQEHLDYHKTFDSLKESFLKFAYQTKGKVIGCGDDVSVRKILDTVNGISYGLEEFNQFRAVDINFDGKFSVFTLVVNNEKKMQVKIPLLGRHNVKNALAVIAFFSYLKEDLNKVVELMKGFLGTKRRFQIKDVVRQVTFVDDYAHHPTEIAAVLEAGRLLNPGRLVAIFQPHRYSRVENLRDEFVACFKAVDKVIVTDIYAASEKPIEGISAEKIVDDINRINPGRALYISHDSLVNEVLALIEPHDLVIGIGAGDINLLMEKIVVEFKKVKINA